MEKPVIHAGVIIKQKVRALLVVNIYGAKLGIFNFMVYNSMQKVMADRCNPMNLHIRFKSGR